MTGEVLSVQVGMAQRMTMPANSHNDGRNPSWRSGIYKAPVEGAVFVGKEIMAGDEHADLKVHGGPDRVVLAYAAEYYPRWREELKRPELAYGWFGENFTVMGFRDDTVCLGDIWKVGEEVVIEVSQPRQPCYKLARRVGCPEVVKLVMERGWGGWYFRVLKEGHVAKGAAVEMIERKHPEWPMTTVVQTMYGAARNPEKAQELGRVAALSADWKRQINGD